MMRLRRWKLVLIVFSVLAVGALLASDPARLLFLAYLYETDLADSTPTDTTVTAFRSPRGAIRSPFTSRKPLPGIKAHPRREPSTSSSKANSSTGLVAAP